MSAQLQFSVSNQLIARTDEFRPVAKSIDYLYAQFEFLTPEWDGKQVTAQFRKQDSATTYEYILDENNTCLVPHEVLDGNGGYICVSCFAGDRITVNRAMVFVEQSGYDSNAGSSAPPTPSVYQQILDRLDELGSDVDGGLFTDWQQEGE